MDEFLKTLDRQRWDDHRFYHQSRINQTLHLISALSFIVAYVVVFFDPPVAALIGWIISMGTRQSGHFFFEPLGFDKVHNMSNEHKESIKVGFNLQRKVVLISIWASAPVLMWAFPTLGGLFEAPASFTDYARHVGWLWFWLGVAGLLFRTVHLFFIKDVFTGLVWMTKILTDPFHDVMIYKSAPLHLMRGQLIDPDPNAWYHDVPQERTA